MPADDIRQHPRFRVSLPVVVDLPTGEVKVKSVGVSRTGLSLRLSPVPAIDESIALRIELPDGSEVVGRARCKTHLPGCLCGMSLEFGGEAQARWDSFVDEEESTGPIWRMIGRIADAPDDDFAPRGVTLTSVDGETANLRFHTAGENSLAWRLAFAKQPSDPAEESDLCVRLPGFREPGRRLVRRVLREDVTLRLDPSMPPFRARVVELNRG
ncbi:MAG TPA: PilZ domain-containing protein, partial [Myxococcota bacterium]